MKNPVDSMLTSRIKQVFDEFEDPAADAGWEQLRKKYPERNRRPLTLWLSSAAAILIFVTGLWFVNSQETPMVMTPVKEEKSFGRTDKSTPLNTADSVNSTKTAEKRLSELRIPKRLKERSLAIAEPETAKVLTATPPVTSSQVEPLNLSGLEALAEQSPEKVRAMGLKDEIPFSRAATLVIKNQQDFDKVQIEQAVQPTYIKDGKITTIALEDEIPLSRAATLAIEDRQDFDKVQIEQAKKPTYIKEFNPDPVENEKKVENANAKRQKLALSLFAGSYFNYAEGSENQLNFGAGFTSDIRLSRNLKLSTGLSIASNSLDYDSGQDVPESAASSFNSVAPSTGQNASRDLTTITRYSASLLTLDIPVNIKYEFVPESDKIYVLAGLSSGTYLNETYGYQYRNFNTASGYYSSQAKAQEIKRQLNDFDFARTLNLSFGISTPFGKTQTISFEPFVKYPLGGLGTENLKFGSTGINLKIRFKPSKN